MNEPPSVQAGVMDGVEQVKDGPQMNHNNCLPTPHKRQSVDNDILLTPLETAILHMLHFSGNHMDSDEITKNMQKVFWNVKPTDVISALNYVLVCELGYVNEVLVNGDDGDNTRQYAVSDKAIRMYFSYDITYRRKINHVGMEVMLRIADQMMRKGLCCKLHLGDCGVNMPYMQVYGPKTTVKDKMTRLMHGCWNGDAGLTIRLENDPTKHLMQTYMNWKKSVRINSVVWFVVYSKNHADAIHEKFHAMRVNPSSYTIIIVTEDDMVDNTVDLLMDVAVQHYMQGRWLPTCRPNSNDRRQDGPRVSGLKAYQGITDIFGMTELEHEICRGINNGLSTAPSKVRRRIGSVASDADIRQAINRLYQRGYICLYWLHHRVTMEPFNGGIPDKVFCREKIMGRVGVKAQINTMAGFDVPSDLSRQKPDML